MRVFSLAENSNSYFWRDVGIFTWARAALSSTTPDGQNWLAGSSGFPGTAIIGGTRSGNKIWFAWNAATDSNFQQPHVEMVTLDRVNDFNRIQQVQIWNNNFAFAYPGLWPPMPAPAKWAYRWSGEGAATTKTTSSVSGGLCRVRHNREQRRHDPFRRLCDDPTRASNHGRSWEPIQRVRLWAELRPVGRWHTDGSSLCSVWPTRFIFSNNLLA